MRGQRTKTNARTRKGKVKTVANRVGGAMRVRCCWKGVVSNCYQPFLHSCIGPQIHVVPLLVVCVLMPQCDIMKVQSWNAPLTACPCCTPTRRRSRPSKQAAERRLRS